MKKFAFIFLVVMIVLFIVMDFVDRANANKKDALPDPTPAVAPE